MSQPKRYYDHIFSAIGRQIQEDPMCREKIGRLHSSGFHLHLVRDPRTGEYLVPTYDGLAEQIEEAYLRLRQLEEGAEDDHESRMRAFYPYPTPLAPSIFKSNRVAIIDSGILTGHPLLQGKIAAQMDFTGEGIEDTCGHGTIEAIRQVLYEPYAQLVIAKAFFGRDGGVGTDTLVYALKWLRNQEIGYVFVAGGIDALEYPEQGRLVCKAARALVEEKGLDLESTGFVATKGNIGDKGKWCPAAAEGVWGVSVTDKDTYENPLGVSAGLAVGQKGPYASFPDITPMRLGDFYYNYAETFRQHNFPELSQAYAERALAYPYTDEEQTLALLSTLAAQMRNWPRALDLIQKRLERQPDTPELYGERATALLSLGRESEAESDFKKATELGTRDPAIWHNYGLLLEHRNQMQQALTNYIEAARRDPHRLAELQRFGWRAYYDEDYGMAIVTNQALVELDPTFAAAYYNMCISYGLKGDTKSAEICLTHYEQARVPLDTSPKRYDTNRTLSFLQDQRHWYKATLFAYALDQDRRYAYEYKLIRDLLQETAGEQDRQLAALSEFELSRLARGATECATRLVLSTDEPPYQDLIKLLEQICQHLPHSDHAEVAEIHESLARLHHRLGNFNQAASALSRAVTHWEEVNATRRSAAQVEIGLLQIAARDFAGAHQSLMEVEVYIPRLYTGLTLLALQDDNLTQARERLQLSFHGNEDNPESLLLLLGIQAREGQMEAAYQTLWHILWRVNKDDNLQRIFKWLLNNYPFYNFALEEGHTVLDYFYNRHEVPWVGAVSLVSDSIVPLEQVFNPTTGEYRGIIKGCTEALAPDADAMKVAIIGSGLLLNHPCLTEHIVQSIDFTDEGPQDRNGSTTMQALQFLQWVRTNRQPGSEPEPFALMSAKVINGNGRGGAQDLIGALLWAQAHGAKLIQTHVQTERHDMHLIGTVRRVARGAIIVTLQPDQDRGTGFPGMVEEHVQIADTTRGS